MYVYIWCSQLCRRGTLDPAKVKGKIVRCFRDGKIKSVAEGNEALSSGAQGMILDNQKQNGKTTFGEPHVLSTVGTNNGHAGPQSDFYLTAT